MKTKVINQRVHSLLEPLGFNRKGSSNLWNRRIDGFIDVLDIQVSQFSSTYTINIGVVDVVAFQIFKDGAPPEFVYEPDATIRDRIGSLIDRYEKWWEIDDPDSADDTVTCIRDYALPFFESHKSHQAVRDWLIERGAEKYPYPPLSMNLAILEQILGDDMRAKEILKNKRDKTHSEPWRKAIEELALRLNIEL